MKKLLQKLQHELSRPRIITGPLAIMVIVSVFCYKAAGTELDIVRLISHEVDKVIYNLTTPEKFDTNSSGIESTEPEMVEVVVNEEPTEVLEENEARCELAFLQPGSEFVVSVGVCKLNGRIDAGQEWVNAYNCNATDNVLRAHAFTPKFNEIECNDSLSIEHNGEEYNFSCAFRTNAKNYGDHIEVEVDGEIVDLEVLKTQYDLVTYCCQDHSGLNITCVFWSLVD